MNFLAALWQFFLVLLPSALMVGMFWLLNLYANRPQRKDRTG